VPHRLTWLDVFTDSPLRGNALAVVHGADDLDDAAMLAFARETRLSETTFVQRPTTPEATYRNRIFWTRGETPFAGHPSLGTAVAVARERGEAEVRYVQETPAGLQPVDVSLDGDRGYASVVQEPAAFADEVDAAPVLSAVGLDPGAAHPELPVQGVSTGRPNLIAPVRDIAALERVRPSLEQVDEVLRTTGCGVIYVVAIDAGGAGAQARAFFTDQHAVTEDPATGSAAGPLCAYLAKRGVSTRVVVDQGVEMGRPSRLDCELEGDRVRVGGGVVVLADGELRI
jgi:trans-2,3-dihydro-3-hydroxyanthranilate isomerase